jgi:hypothetical protein
VFRTLGKLFQKRDRLSALSSQSDRRSFIRALVEADVTVLAALQSEGLDAATFTQEELLAEIEKAAKDLSERTSFEPFVYRNGESRCLPFFSNPDHAQTFSGEYSKERHRVFPFQSLGVSGAVLVSLLPGCDAMVLNARSADEYVLSQADMRLLGESGLITAEADRDRHPGFPGFNVLAGGPGSLAERSAHM